MGAKIFISWSGETSFAVARILYHRIPEIIQAAEPWMSQKDIEKGRRWSNEIAKQLDASQFGIICVTPDNQDSRWLQFEAGALSKSVKEAYVCPLLQGLNKRDLSPPLSQFQAVSASDRDDVFQMMSAINSSADSSLIGDDLLKKSFERTWEDLCSELGDVTCTKPTKSAIRSTDEVMDEILGTVRRIERQQKKTTVSVTHIIRPTESDDPGTDLGL